jgi:hypothetical protein
VLWSRFNPFRETSVRGTLDGEEIMGHKLLMSEPTDSSSCIPVEHGVVIGRLNGESGNSVRSCLAHEGQQLPNPNLTIRKIHETRQRWLSPFVKGIQSPQSTLSYQSHKLHRMPIRLTVTAVNLGLAILKLERTEEKTIHLRCPPTRV